MLDLRISSRTRIATISFYSRGAMMKIAFVTDDGQTISQHFGRAAYYEVVTLENGSVTGRERRAKPAHEGHHHHHEGESVVLHVGQGPWEDNAPVEDTHGAMAAPIRDCQVVLSRGMGRGAYDSLRGAGVEPIITDVRDIDEAMRQYLNGELADHPERLH
jgi:predicted Fe-Mo cluster-binding NifX family protein